MDFPTIIGTALISVGFGFVGSILTIKFALPAVIGRFESFADEYVQHLPEKLQNEPEIIKGMVVPFVNYLRDKETGPEIIDAIAEPFMVYITDPKVAKGLAHTLIPAFMAELGSGQAGGFKDVKLGPIKVPGVVMDGIAAKFLGSLESKATNKVFEGFG